MTTTEEITRRLDSLLEVPDRRDWVDVERRARRRRLPRGGAARLLLVAAAATAVGAPIAVGLGIKEHVIASGGSSDDVPRAIRRQFALMGRPEPDVGGPPRPSLTRGLIVSSVRRAAVFALADGRTETIYAAPTRSGGICWNTMISGVSGGGSCISAPGSKQRAPDLDIGWSGGGQASRILLVADGYIRSSATSLRVGFEDGTQQTVGVRSHWTAFEIDSSHAAAGHRPSTLTALAPGGRVVATQSDPFRMLHPAPKRVLPTPASIRLLTTARVPVGGRVYLAEGAATSGDRCTRTLRIGRSRFGGNWDGGWQCGPEVGAAVGGHSLSVQSGVESGFATGLGWVYYHGWAAPSVRSLRVQFQDQTSEPIALHDGYFLYAVPASRFAPGRRPSAILAYDQNHTRIQTENLYPRRRCWFPTRDPICKTYQVANG